MVLLLLYYSAGVVAHQYIDGSNTIAELSASDDTLDWDDTCALAPMARH